MNLWRGNQPGALVVALVCVVWFSAPVKGRQAPGAPSNQVESDPIKCWWKTDTNAVRVGEPFTLALTCGVIETDAVRVVVDPARLDPAVVEATPFEVLGGTRHDDIVAPPWRYFQYSYTLRLLGETFFGRDVDIPGLPLTYRVQPANGDAGQARDQLYLLPALPLRVVSLVPVTATDIRDAPSDTFADIESRRWRATREFAAAGVFFALAALLAGVAAVRAFRRSRVSQPDAVRLLPLAAVFGACEREVQTHQVRHGWRVDAGACRPRPGRIPHRRRCGAGPSGRPDGNWRTRTAARRSTAARDGAVASSPRPDVGVNDRRGNYGTVGR